MGKSNKKFKRDQRGQALIEGAVSLVLITMLVVGGTLLIIGTGLAIYYKAKLAYAAQIGAKTGGEGKYWLGAPRPNYSNTRMLTDVRNAVNAALIGLGLPRAADGKIDARETTVNGVHGVQVSVEESGLEIISGGLLPPTLTMTETAFYPYSINDPIGVLGLSVEGVGSAQNGIGMFIPVYGGGENSGVIGHTGIPNPPGGVDYWKIGIQRDVSTNTGISKYGGLEERKVLQGPQRENH